MRHHAITSGRLMNRNNKMNIGIVQQSFTNDRHENIRSLQDGIKLCRRNGAELVILPELHNTPYFCQSQNPANFDWAEPIPGPSTEAFGRLAKELGVVLVLSLFEKRSSRMYHNTAVVIDSDGSIAGRYRKMHIPDDPGYYEKYYFTPGDLGFEPIKTSVAHLGVLVCWDQWFPEAARIMALKGAEILIYPTAIGWDPRDDDAEKERQLNAWITVQRSHAIANVLPVVSVNRVGYEKDPTGATSGAQFWGHSFVAGVQGEILLQADAREARVNVEVDITNSEKVSRIWPFFRDRRTDHYSALSKLDLD